MKFKKILIIILSVALLSCFAVSTFATDANTAATIPDYGFYISPGEYVFDEDIDFSSLSYGDTNFHFDFISINHQFSVLNLFRNADGIRVAFYYLDPGIASALIYSGDLDSFAWSNLDYRYITVLNGFYITDINFYQFWTSNVTRVDSGYDNNLLDGILSSFTFIGELIAGAANAVTPMFWDGEALTVVGTLSVAGLSFAVVFLLIALVSSFMKFRS